MSALPDAERYYSGLRRALEAAGDVESSAQMSRYLRDQFGFLGVKTPERRSIQRTFRDTFGELPQSELETFVMLCWKDPHRELQHTAIDLAIRASKKVPEDIWQLYESMIIEKSWWDSVDPIATTLMTTHLRRFESLNPKLPDRWIESSSIWLQRTALLFQLKYKSKTNPDQLFRYIDAVRESEEFFLQKAAGWALREYSRHDANAVRTYVLATDLPALTAREAMKLLDRN